RPTGPDVLGALGSAANGEAHDEQAPRTFVGRKREMESLLDAFQTSVGGRGMTVHLHGDSGIGKTALFEHFADVVGETHRALVLRGRSYAQESLPFKALDGAMDELSRLLAARTAGELAALLPPNADDLACLFPTLRRVPPLAHAVDRQNRADERPVLEVRR